MQGHRNISKLCGNTLKSCADMDTIYIYIYYIIYVHYMELIWTCVGIWWFRRGKNLSVIGISLRFLQGYLLFNGRFPECGGANDMQIGMIEILAISYYHFWYVIACKHVCLHAWKCIPLRRLMTLMISIAITPTWSSGKTTYILSKKQYLRV